MSRNIVSCTQPGGQENDFEWTPTVQMERQHSMGAPPSCDFPRFVIVSQISRPEVGSRSRCYQKRALLEKTTPCGKVLKISSRKYSPSRRSTSCVQISWNLADRKSAESCVIYRTNKTKKSARSLALACAQIAPKICQSQRQTMYSQYPKFHPSRFTSGGVIAERVNTVQTLHKVFPTLGEASASSPNNKISNLCDKI